MTPQLPIAAWILVAQVTASAGASAPREGPTTARSVRLVDGSTKATRAAKGGVTVLVFCSAECPISNAYSPVLNALVREWPADRVSVVGVFIDPDRSDAEVKAHAAEYGLTFPVASDRSGRLARGLGVGVTPEAVVLDDRDEVVYLGRIDDAFAARGKKRPRTSARDLKDAVADVLAGRPVARPRVEAVGCPLPEVPEAPRDAPQGPRTPAPPARPDARPGGERPLSGPSAA